MKKSIKNNFKMVQVFESTDMPRYLNDVETISLITKPENSFWYEPTDLVEYTYSEPENKYNIISVKE